MGNPQHFFPSLTRVIFGGSTPSRSFLRCGVCEAQETKGKHFNALRGLRPTPGPRTLGHGVPPLCFWRCSHRMSVILPPDVINAFFTFEYIHGSISTLILCNSWKIMGKLLEVKTQPESAFIGVRLDIITGYESLWKKERGEGTQKCRIPSLQALPRKR